MGFESIAAPTALRDAASPPSGLRALSNFLIARNLAIARTYTLSDRLNLALARTPGDKLGPYEIVAPIRRDGMGAHDARREPGKSDNFGFTDPNNGNSTKLTVFFFAELRRGRSDRDSSLWSTPPRSLSRTSPSNPPTHRLPRERAAGSSNRRSGRHGCRST